MLRRRRRFSSSSCDVEEVPPSEITAKRGDLSVVATTTVWDFLANKLFNYYYYNYNYDHNCVASNVLTGNINETWNSRCFAPASIVLELKKKRRIVGIDLMPDMMPEAGMVRHVITLSNHTPAAATATRASITTTTNTTNINCCYFYGEACNRSWIHVDTTTPTTPTTPNTTTPLETKNNNNIYYNRIEIATTLSPSWVAWRQIKVFAVA